MTIKCKVILNSKFFIKNNVHDQDLDQDQDKRKNINKEIQEDIDHNLHKINMIEDKNIIEEEEIID